MLVIKGNALWAKIFEPDTHDMYQRVSSLCR